MAATLHELFAGRTETMGAKPKAEIAYVVLGAADEAEVRAIAQAQIPAAYLGIPRSSITLDERLNATTWKVRAAFETSDSASTEIPQPVFSFETGGGTQHKVGKRHTADPEYCGEHVQGDQDRAPGMARDGTQRARP